MRQLRVLGQPALLHSAERRTRFGRYDILSAGPKSHYRLEAGTLFCDEQCLWQSGSSEGNPFSALQADLRERHGIGVHDRDQHDQAPFRRGYIGYFGFGLNRLLDRQCAPPPDPTSLPMLCGGYYDWCIVTDHRRRQSTLWTSGKRQQEQVQALLLSTLGGAEAEELAAVTSDAAPEHTRLTSPFRSSMTQQDYLRAFQQIRHYTEAGDCYQINVARHFSATFDGDPLTVYEQWLNRQGAPFCAYLEPTAKHAILSLSPERFLRVTGRQGEQQAEVAPIKGTRPRSANREEDQALRLRLLRSAKDRAENLMIVDLLRNDLSRVAVTGSVQVRNLCEPLAFANVHHLVSTIGARLHARERALDAVAALFPSGSVTGAPKLRAIDIIHELEPVARSVYCGALGYLNEYGELDSSVTIRSAVAECGRLHLWGGGGVVLDSAADRELDEIRDKIGALLEPF